MTGIAPKLQIRHGDRVFGPATFSQVRQLLNAGKIQDTDSVREDNGPWIVIRDYLEWKGETSGSLGDISELLGDLGPASPSPSSVPAAKPRKEQKSQAVDDDYIPLADPDPDLIETKEVAVQPPPAEKRREKQRQVQRDPSDDVIPLSDRPSSTRKKRDKERGSDSGSRRSNPATPPPRSSRKSAPSPSSREHSLAESQFNLPMNADLDAILNAMVEYEAAAPALKKQTGRSRSSGS